MMSRQETVRVIDEEAEQDLLLLNWVALFNGRTLGDDSLISIGPANGEQVSIHTRIDLEMRFSSTGSQFPDEILLIQVNFRGFKQEFPLLSSER